MSCGKYSNKDFFNEMAPEWDKITCVWPEKIGHILDVAQLRPGAKVMDVGTGTGVLIPYIKERVGADGSIDAVDISDGMLARAAEKYGGLSHVRFLNADIESDNIEDVYDAIFMYCMYPHLEHPIETLQWLSKVNLADGGHIVIAFPERKESINGIHRHNDGSVHSDKLQDGEQFGRTLADYGIRADYIEDNDDYYIIRIAKG